MATINDNVPPPIHTQRKALEQIHVNPINPFCVYFGVGDTEGEIHRHSVVLDYMGLLMLIEKLHDIREQLEEPAWIIDYINKQHGIHSLKDAFKLSGVPTD